MHEPPSWITTFSQPQLWRTLASEKQASFVLGQFPDDVVERIATKLPQIATAERRIALPHLLRHWATSRIRSAEVLADFLEAKEVRRRVGKLRRSMLDARAAFRALGDEGLTLLSQKNPGPDPVGDAYRLLRDQVALVDQVTALVDQALADRPRPGPKPKNELVAHIASLAEIYVHVTGLEPTRTADPVSGTITGAFVEFARACLRAFDPKAHDRFDWSIRRALELRAGGEDRPV